jgi:competence protein ComEA
VLHRRPDPAVAVGRLAALAHAQPVGGWVPPPVDADVDELLSVAEPVDDAYERSWQRRPESEPEDGPSRWVAWLVPAGVQGGRWDPGRRGAAALAAVAVVAAVLAGFVVLRGRPHELPAASVSTPATAAPAVAGRGGPIVIVDVAGKVRHPGLVRLPFGARVDDALRAAGGALAGASLDGLNLARKLTDGEQVLVGTPAVGGPAAVGAPGGQLDLNAADVSALDGLPGIGPVLAQKIVDWRTEHGRFASVDQLREVGGIGESKFAALKNKVRV